MMIALHKNARTTPAVRAEIASSAEPVARLAQRYSVSESTVRKWKKTHQLQRCVAYGTSPANHPQPHCNSADDLEHTLLRYVALYNHHLPQSALKSQTPMQTMKQWYVTHPHLFHKRSYDQAERDTPTEPLVPELPGNICLLSLSSWLHSLKG